MQVKEMHPWEILRDFLAQDDSTGLMMTEYFSYPKAFRAKRSRWTRQSRRARS
jgi:hypothetical protein